MILEKDELQFIESLANSKDGQKLSLVLTKMVQELNSVSNIGTLESEKGVDVAKVVMGRMIAVETLTKFLQKIRLLKTPPSKKEKGRKDEYR